VGEGLSLIWGTILHHGGIFRGTSPKPERGHLKKEGVLPVRGGRDRAIGEKNKPFRQGGGTWKGESTLLREKGHWTDIQREVGGGGERYLPTEVSDFNVVSRRKLPERKKKRVLQGKKEGKEAPGLLIW